MSTNTSHKGTTRRYSDAFKRQVVEQIAEGGLYATRSCGSVQLLLKKYPSLAEGVWGKSSSKGYHLPDLGKSFTKLQKFRKAS